MSFWTKASLGDQMPNPAIKIIDTTSEKRPTTVSDVFITPLLSLDGAKYLIKPKSNPNLENTPNKPTPEISAVAKPTSFGVYSLATKIQNTNPTPAVTADDIMRKIVFLYSGAWAKFVTFFIEVNILSLLLSEGWRFAYPGLKFPFLGYAIWSIHPYFIYLEYLYLTRILTQTEFVTKFLQVANVLLARAYAIV